VNNIYLFRTDDNLKDIMLKDILPISKEEKFSTGLSRVNYNIGPVVCAFSLNSYTHNFKQNRSIYIYFVNF